MNKEDLKYALNESKGAAWVVIVIIFIIFFPFGIWLALEQVKKDRIAAISGSQAAKFSAITIMILGVMWVIAGLSALPDFTVAWLAALGVGSIIGGFFLYKKFKEYETLSARYKRYLRVIVNGDCYNIEKIAETIGVDIGTVETILQEMIKLDIFRDAYINHKTGELMWDDTLIEDLKIQYAVVECPNCSATQNVAVGKKSSCEYCGSALSAGEFIK